MEKTHKITPDIHKGYQEPEWLITLKNLIREVKAQKSQKISKCNNNIKLGKVCMRYLWIA